MIDPPPLSPEEVIERLEKLSVWLTYQLPGSKRDIEALDQAVADLAALRSSRIERETTTTEIQDQDQSRPDQSDVVTSDLRADVLAEIANAELITCALCRGRGRVGDDVCYYCEGAGTVKAVTPAQFEKLKSLSPHIPVAVRDEDGGPW